MSGHPHKGKRSRWRNILKSPPTMKGEYEITCRDEVFTGVWTSYLQAHEDDWQCDQCQWRGLAENPE